jgi:hypothetical protein
VSEIFLEIFATSSHESGKINARIIVEFYCDSSSKVVQVDRPLSKNKA